MLEVDCFPLRGGLYVLPIRRDVLLVVDEMHVAPRVREREGVHRWVYVLGVRVCPKDWLVTAWVF